MKMKLISELWFRHVQISMSKKNVIERKRDRKKKNIEFHFMLWQFLVFCLFVHIVESKDDDRTNLIGKSGLQAQKKKK